MSTISLLNQLPTNNLLFPVLNSFILYNPANACLSRFLRLCCSSLASWKRSCVTTVILVFGNKIPEVLMHQCWQSATKLLHITSLCAILVRPWYAQFIRPKQTGFCFGLSSLLSSTFFFWWLTHRQQWQNCQQFIRGPNPFRCCIQVSELFSALLPFSFPFRYPFDATELIWTSDIQSACGTISLQTGHSHSHD